jgi:peptidoglycan/xylan/chitin deacetylase (PgdA/CDA1 family)
VEDPGRRVSGRGKTEPRGPTRISVAVTGDQVLQILSGRSTRGIASTRKATFISWRFLCLCCVSVLCHLFQSRLRLRQGNRGMVTTQNRANRVTNLTAHGVGPPARELHPDEAATWVDIAQLEWVLDVAMECPTIRLTFDDGNCSDVHIALPRLLERGLKAEFFLLAGCIGEPGRIDRSGLRELVSAGMLIGSHGWAHRDWRRLDDAAAEQEIHQALRTLTELSGQAVDRVAVPFGSYDRTVLWRLRRAGVSRIYTSDGGRARGDAWLQPRTSLRSDMTPEGARVLADGRAGLLESTRRLAAQSVKRWRGPVRAR